MIKFCQRVDHFTKSPLSCRTYFKRGDPGGKSSKMGINVSDVELHFIFLQYRKRDEGRRSGCSFQTTFTADWWCYSASWGWGWVSTQMEKRTGQEPNVTGTGHGHRNYYNSAVTWKMSNTGHMGFTTRGLFTGECAQTAATEKMSALNNITVGSCHWIRWGSGLFLRNGLGGFLSSQLKMLVCWSGGSLLTSCLFENAELQKSDQTKLMRGIICATFTFMRI